MTIITIIFLSSFANAFLCDLFGCSRPFIIEEDSGDGNGNTLFGGDYVDVNSPTGHVLIDFDTVSWLGDSHTYTGDQNFNFVDGNYLCVGGDCIDSWSDVNAGGGGLTEADGNGLYVKLNPINQQTINNHIFSVRPTGGTIGFDFNADLVSSRIESTGDTGLTRLMSDSVSSNELQVYGTDDPATALGGHFGSLNFIKTPTNLFTVNATEDLTFYAGTNNDGGEIKFWADGDYLDYISYRTYDTRPSMSFVNRDGNISTTETTIGFDYKDLNKINNFYLRRNIYLLPDSNISSLGTSVNFDYKDLNKINQIDVNTINSNTFSCKEKISNEGDYNGDGSIQLDGGLFLGSTPNSSIVSDADSLNIVANHDTISDGLELTAGSFKYKVPTNYDIIMNYDSTTHDGQYRWQEDEDYFQYNDDILMNSTEKLYFRDTAINIYSSSDGYMYQNADGGITQVTNNAYIYSPTSFGVTSDSIIWTNSEEDTVFTFQNDGENEMYAFYVLGAPFLSVSSADLKLNLGLDVVIQNDLTLTSGNLVSGGKTYSLTDLNETVLSVCSGDVNSVWTTSGCVNISDFAVAGVTGIIAGANIDVNSLNEHVLVSFNDGNFLTAGHTWVGDQNFNFVDANYLCIDGNCISGWGDVNAGGGGDGISEADANNMYLRKGTTETQTIDGNVTFTGEIQTDNDCGIPNAVLLFSDGSPTNGSYWDTAGTTTRGYGQACSGRITAWSGSCLSAGTLLELSIDLNSSAIASVNISPTNNDVNSVLLDLRFKKNDMIGLKTVTETDPYYNCSAMIYVSYE